MCHYFYGFFKQSQAKFSTVVEGFDAWMPVSHFFLNLKYPKMSEALKASVSIANHASSLWFANVAFTIFALYYSSIFSSSVSPLSKPHFLLVT